jgi:hypothetical protein
MELEARPLRVATTDHIIVDDFESYNDLDPTDPASNRIFNVWIDGYEQPTNGALVGYDVPPFAEQSILYGGKQAQRPNAPLLFRRIGLKPALRHSCCTSTAPRGTLGSCI